MASTGGSSLGAVLGQTNAGPSVQQIQRPVPLRERIYEMLVESIVSRALEPGQHLIETELAEQLGVSRQPVREALQWLNNEGWVDLRPGYGAFVHIPTDEEVDQLLAVRALLETEAARLAAGHATDEDVAELRKIWQRGVDAVEADDIDNVVAANAALHRRVAELSQNEVLSGLAAQVDRRVRWYYTPIARQRGPESWREHADLIDSIEAHDQERAEAVMGNHTRQTQTFRQQQAAAS